MSFLSSFVRTWHNYTQNNTPELFDELHRKLNRLSPDGIGLEVKSAHQSRIELFAFVGTGRAVVTIVPTFHGIDIAVGYRDREVASQIHQALDYRLQNI